MTPFKNCSQRERRITVLFIIIYFSSIAMMFVTTTLREPEVPIIVDGSDDGTEFEHIRWFELREIILEHENKVYYFNGIVDEYWGGTLIISLRYRGYYYDAVEYLYVPLDYSSDIKFKLEETRFTIISYSSQETRVRLGWN